MMAMFQCRSLLPSRPICHAGDGLGRTSAHTALAATPALPAQRRVRWISALAVLWSLFLAQSTALSALADDYHVDRGDVLEISVLGSQELHRHLMIGDDGKVYFPVVGELYVAGLSLSQIRQQFHDRLAANHAFHNPDVTVNIAAYRPIYVSHGVAKPGAYPYHPGMTVRDAIALAGGYGRDLLLEGINARDQYAALSIGFVRLQIDVARLQEELAGRTEIELKTLRSTGVAPQVLSEFVNMEAQQLKMDQNDYDNEKMHLTRLVKETQDQISALLAEQAQQQLALTQQQKDLARVRDLFQKSLVQISRVEEEERAISSLAMQFFEVKARTAQARRSLEDYTRTLEKLADHRKSEIIQRLEAATGELATAKVHLETASVRVNYVETEGPQGFQDGGEVRDLVIFRSDRHGDQQRIAADENTSLLPGDTVTIAASGPPSGLVSSVGSRVTAHGPDPGRPATSVSAKRQLRDGKRLDATVRAASLPVRVAAAAASDTLVAAPLPAAPKPSPAAAHQAPVRMPRESTASAASPPLQHSAIRNRRAASAMPPSAAERKTAPPAAVPSGEGRAAGQSLRQAGDMRILAGDLASARLFYARAAEAGDARAALDLGHSFNPAFLRQLGAVGMRGDANAAAHWYRRARRLGDPDAEKALQTLPR